MGAAKVSTALVDAMMTMDPTPDFSKCGISASQPLTVCSMSTSKLRTQFFSLSMPAPALTPGMKISQPWRLSTLRASHALYASPSRTLTASPMTSTSGGEPALMWTSFANATIGGNSPAGICCSIRPRRRRVTDCRWAIGEQRATSPQQRGIMMEKALRELLDKQQIYEVALRYCRGLDRMDFELVRSCYHPDGIDHHTGFSGLRDEWVA